MSEETQKLPLDNVPLLQRRWVRTIILIVATLPGFAVGRWGFQLELNWSLLLGVGFAQLVAGSALDKLAPLPKTERDSLSWDGALLFAGVLLVFFLFAIAVSDFFTI